MRKLSTKFFNLSLHANATTAFAAKTALGNNVSKSQTKFSIKGLDNALPSTNPELEKATLSGESHSSTSAEKLI